MVEVGRRMDEQTDRQMDVEMPQGLLALEEDLSQKSTGPLGWQENMKQELRKGTHVYKRIFQCFISLFSFYF